ncbi:hypothetical protein [Lactococcus phage CHPC971]|uniref:Capsid and scaffold protein n=1 Tax=Lactococcus phage CHPC971 TaxID=2575255 RepID=A0A4Y5N178_9CAUD|nr:tail protein [Lactococcus phage CHPC971]QCW07625.1 hypothetical protein [Lactococcus phage CHPC971]
MTIVASNSLTLSNINDGTITHTAYAWSADGTDGFTTTYPNLNLLSGTKDFSGFYLGGWENDGTFKGLTVKKRTWQWGGIHKTFTAPKDGTYTFSAYVKSSGNNANIYRFVGANSSNAGGIIPDTFMGNNFDWLRDSFQVTLKTGDTVWAKYEISGSGTDSALWNAGHKWEEGSIATPYIQSASEVTTADWPKYIGHYTDFTQADSTNPSDYTWGPMRGDDGKDGTNGKDGIAGKDGDPGKTVSNTEPISLFKGLTWKYSGTTDLTASDGTVIHPNTEYYYNGTHWVINYFSVNNFASESITSDKIDGKNLTITNGEFISKTSNGPVTISTDIKDNHIAISKTDATVNTQNDIALDSEQGLIQNFTNNSTGFYRTAGINFQGPFTNDSNGNYAQLTPQGTKLSTDTPWTTLASTGGFSGGTIQFSIQNGVAYFSVSGVSVPSMTGGTWYQCAQLPTGSRAIPSVNRVTTAFANTSVWGFLVSVSGGLYFQSKNNTSATGNLANVLAAFPIG